MRSKILIACHNPTKNYQPLKFAFNALGNNQLVFTLVEIKKGCPDIDIDANFNGYGLLQTVEYAEKASKCLSFNFIHLCIQEFLAAHYITTLQPKEALSILQDNFWNNLVYILLNQHV